MNETKLNELTKDLSVFSFTIESGDGGNTYILTVKYWLDPSKIRDFVELPREHDEEIEARLKSR